MAIDVGEIRADGRSAELREAGIALVEGRPTGLFSLAPRLFPGRRDRIRAAAAGGARLPLAEEGRIAASGGAQRRTGPYQVRRNRRACRA